MFAYEAFWTLKEGPYRVEASIGGEDEGLYLRFGSSLRLTFEGKGGDGLGIGRQLPSCPYKCSTLVVSEGELYRRL